MNERTDLDENEVLDFGCLLEDALELWQEVVGGDDVADFSLVDAEGDGVVAEVGDEQRALLVVETENNSTLGRPEASS